MTTSEEINQVLEVVGRRRTVLLHVVQMNAPVCQDVVEGAQPRAVPLLSRLGSDPKHACEQLAGKTVRHNQRRRDDPQKPLALERTSKSPGAAAERLLLPSLTFSVRYRSSDSTFSTSKARPY